MKKISDLFKNDKLKEKIENMKLEKEYRKYKKEKNRSIKNEERQTISDFLNQENINNKLIEQKEKKNKFNVENIKEIALVSTAILLVGIGYVNFSKEPQTNLQNTLATSSSNNIGDVQLVNSDAVLVDNENEVVSENQQDNKGEIVNNEEIEKEDSKEEENSEIVDNKEIEKKTEVNSNQTTSNKAYFTELRLNRDNLYSVKIDTYQKIIDSTTISAEQKSIAVQEIDKLTTQKNSISIAEELIRLKGFEDAVIYINDDSVSVVIRIAVLSLEQVAQIQNIVSRELNVEVKNINISNK